VGKPVRLAGEAIRQLTEQGTEGVERQLWGRLLPRRQADSIMLNGNMSGMSPVGSTTREV
jgi:hypothetical protein